MHSKMVIWEQISEALGESGKYSNDIQIDSISCMFEDVYLHSIMLQAAVCSSTFIMHSTHHM